MLTSTVESLKEDMSLLDNKATMNDLEHSSALHGIGVLLSIILGDVCSSDRTEKLCMGSVRQACSHHHTFRNRATW